MPVKSFRLQLLKCAKIEQQINPEGAIRFICQN